MYKPCKRLQKQRHSRDWLSSKRDLSGEAVLEEHERMCGIVGYIGARQAVEVIMDGLSRLEYRGYDSAGVAVNDGREIVIEKKKGRLQLLEEELKVKPLCGCMGIGHTRWATHGEPSDANSHPHSDETCSLAVVHNGIIENYLEIKNELKNNGVVFKSETDTEVVSHLIDFYYSGDLLDAVYKTLERVRGAYALGVIHKDRPDVLIAARKDSPLVIGVGEGENFIASDIPALLKYTKNVYLLDDGDVAVLTRDTIEVYDLQRKRVSKELTEITWDLESATKGGYPHFMIKEIYEQPHGIKETITRRLDENGLVRFDDIKLTREDLAEIESIYIVACGTAYHAGLVGRKAIEKIARIKVETDISSEFRYDTPFIDEKTLVILVSQSGETLDTLAALREARKRGARTLAITNVMGSSIAREAEHVIYTWAGPEISVASTKAYTTQITCLFMLALDMAFKKNVLDLESYRTLLEKLKGVPEKIEAVIENEPQVRQIADKLVNVEHGFFIGRGMDYCIALEGSLKMKEISYVHTEAFAAGELKHGTIALIEPGTPVIALATQQNLFEKSISNIKEVKARGAYVIGITVEGNTLIEQVADDVLYVPRVDDLFAGLVGVVYLQLLAYHVSAMKGLDVDKPRNLAKSVTVE
jgi:glucosamine--fructose-6-phosphate aminotransferase (isomerizing)